ncbi:MAG: STAS domain-containing protein [Candidatus Omnitrophota bacterium]
MFRFIIKNENLICRFAKHMDSLACAKWEEKGYKKIHDKKMPVIFDLNKVEYVSSLFLNVCVKALKRAGQDNFTVINASENVKKIFTISGLDKLIKFKEA